MAPDVRGPRGGESVNGTAALPLRDIHLPVAPGWWPPAPGWWLLAVIALVVAGVAAAALWRRFRRRRALRLLFDRRLAAADTPAGQVAAMSELLRRAARERDPAAAALQGADWLAFLDQDPAGPRFGDDLGRLLLEGGFRRDVDPAAVEALRNVARARFLRWSGGRG